MGERRYFINTGEYWEYHWEGGKRRSVENWRGLRIEYKTLTQRKVYKNYLFFFERAEMVPCEETRVKKIPLLLYGEGKDVFEFFTRRYFGSIVTPEESTLWMEGKGIYIPSELVQTIEFCRKEYGPDTWRPTVRELSPAEFLEVVNNVKEELAAVGVDEQNLKAQICAFLSRDEERKRKEAAEVAARKKAEEEQCRRQDEAAKNALDDMLNG